MTQNKDEGGRKIRQSRRSKSPFGRLVDTVSTNQLIRCRTNTDNALLAMTENTLV
ncbi:MAG: hypothetical protein NT010_14410 [Proteobacteria bacterium]|nr:hypothetical protein [Pseudomonadota bacterium]